MSRLSRLRSFWRSLRRGTVRDGSYRPHAAVNLLPQEYRPGGGLRTDGSWVLSASTGTKEHGTTSAIPTTGAACSSHGALGAHLAGEATLRTHRPASSSTGRGFSGVFTVGDATGLTRRGPAA